MSNAVHMDARAGARVKNARGWGWGVGVVRLDCFGGGFLLLAVFFLCVWFCACARARVCICLLLSVCVDVRAWIFFVPA